MKERWKLLQLLVIYWTNMISVQENYHWNIISSSNCYLLPLLTVNGLLLPFEVINYQAIIVKKSLIALQRLFNKRFWNGMKRERVVRIWIILKYLNLRLNSLTQRSHEPQVQMKKTLVTKIKWWMMVLETML